MIMEHSCIGLNVLPDEILMIILQKLNNIDVLYSFQGVNQRLNKIIHDPIFTSRLTFVKWLSDNLIDLFSCDIMLNRFCQQILPEIHDKIKWLDLESSSMKHILRAADYPNLDSLALYNIDEESAQCLFTDETLATGIFKNQITTLFITINNSNIDGYEEMQLSVANICDKIFIVFTRLITLEFFDSSYKNCDRLTFEDPLLLHNFRSSSLLKLTIRLECFGDCLDLLDGRFNQLHTLYVDLFSTDYWEEIENQDALPTLKYFSLSCDRSIHNYNQTILPLLYRMSNLEQLDLCLSVHFNETFIDGNDLKRNIIYHMPRLNQFIFYINSFVCTRNTLNLPSTEDIQRTLIDFPNNEIICYIDHFPETYESQCHIYSYPYQMEYYSLVTNNFPRRLFEHVRVVSLYDEHPFEHEFFLQVVQSFPLMKRLSLVNSKSQNRKQSYESNNDNRNLSLIEYSFLTKLLILDVHDDYIEQFLFDTKTYLQNNVDLYINYESLQRVTHNFTRDATRLNCTKISKLWLRSEEKHFNSSLQEYFPYAKIKY